MDNNLCFYLLSGVFWNLRIIKNRLRTCLSDDTLSTLLFLASKRDIIIDITQFPPPPQPSSYKPKYISFLANIRILISSSFVNTVVWLSSDCCAVLCCAVLWCVCVLWCVMYAYCTASGSFESTHDSPSKRRHDVCYVYFCVAVLISKV